MMLDKKSVSLLLMMNDEQLAQIIKGLAANAGIDPNSITIGPKEINGIRAALSNATDSDIQRAMELINDYKTGKGG